MSLTETQSLDFFTWFYQEFEGRDMLVDNLGVGMFRSLDEMDAEEMDDRQRSGSRRSALLHA